jgi:hypothetical protein
MPRAVRRTLPLVMTLLSVGLAACAADGVPAASPSEWRVMVKLVHAGSDGETIARRAGQTAGVPARYLAPASPQWHSLSLACGDESRCAQALGRLRADTSFFEAVERDERRRPHSNPS